MIFIKLTKILLIAWISALTIMSASCEGMTSERPNVLLIFTDDQGWGDVGFNGNKVLKTPSLDALAGSGVRFTDFLASPTCSPSRAALMTGRHEFRSGVTHTIEGRNILRAGVPTMAQAFERSGYRTGIFGKWHLGDSKPFHPLDRGFGHALLVGGGATGQTPDFWGNTMFDPHLQENGVWKPFKGYMTDVFVIEALKWIRSEKKPWFCYLPLNAPHTPLQVAEEWSKPYLDAGLPEDVAKFYGMIANLDAQLGKMLAELSKDGLDRETIVIFLGDNGSWRTCHKVDSKDFDAGLRGGKACAYQGGVRVPAVFSWPGHFAKGAVLKTVAGLCDVLPTLSSICKLDIAGFPSTDGRSLAPILFSGSQPEGWSDRFIPTHPGRWSSDLPADKIPALGGSIRNQKYSLVNGSELYDLESDPGERNDISSSHPEIRDRLRAAYTDWWDSVRGDAVQIQPFLFGLNDHAPIDLTCMDWQPSRSVGGKSDGRTFMQEAILQWQELNGKTLPKGQTDGAVGGWLVDVKTPGSYVLELRQRPREALQQKPFAKGFASIQVGDKTFRAEFPDGSECIRLIADLPAGVQFIEPVIYGQRASGLPQGAYFCTVQPQSALSK